MTRKLSHVLKRQAPTPSGQNPSRSAPGFSPGGVGACRKERAYRTDSYIRSIGSLFPTPEGPNRPPREPEASVSGRRQASDSGLT